MASFKPQHFLLVLCIAAVVSACDQVSSVGVTDRHTCIVVTESRTLSIFTIFQSIFNPTRTVDSDNAKVKSSPKTIANDPVSLHANTTISDGSTAVADTVRPFFSARNHASSTIETFPPNSTLTTSTSTVEAASNASHSQGVTLEYHALPSDTRIASALVTEPLEAKTEAADSRDHAGPDASLEIAFLVLGALLALASVVVAIFFGYKQLNFMRDQSSVRGNNTAGSGNGVDLEMGPVVVSGDASSGVGAGTDPADPSSPPSPV